MRIHASTARSFAGLINQLYSHVAAIMLARAMGAELVLAPAIHRDSFNSHMTKTTWHAAPLEGLLDVEAVKKYWNDQGMLIHTVRGSLATLMCVQLAACAVYAVRAVHASRDPLRRAAHAVCSAHLWWPLPLRLESTRGSVVCWPFGGTPSMCLSVYTLWSQSG